MLVTDLKKADCTKILSANDIPFDPKAEVDVLRDLVRVNGLADKMKPADLKGEKPNGSTSELGKDKGVADPKTQPKPVDTKKKPQTGKTGQVRGLIAHKCEMSREVIEFDVGELIEVDMWKAKKLVDGGVAEWK